MCLLPGWLRSGEVVLTHGEVVATLVRVVALHRAVAPVVGLIASLFCDKRMQKAIDKFVCCLPIACILNIHAEYFG